MIDLSPDRIAVFSYAHVPTMKRQQRAFERDLPGDHEKLDLFLTAMNELMSAGYEHIGMDHFARPTDPLTLARLDRTGRLTFRIWAPSGLTTSLVI